MRASAWFAEYEILNSASVNFMTYVDNAMLALSLEYILYHLSLMMALKSSCC